MRHRNRQIRGSWGNIIECLDRSSPEVREQGKQWYSIANSKARDIGYLAGYGGSMGLRVGAGIISALSPKTHWDNNIIYARQLVQSGYVPQQTASNNNKAIRILNGEEPLNVLGGVKVIPFFNAIVSPTGNDPVPVIDRHAGSVYLGRSLTEKQQKKLANIGVVTRIQNAYRRVASTSNLHVHSVQAITWIQWRLEKEGQ